MFFIVIVVIIIIDGLLVWLNKIKLLALKSKGPRVNGQKNPANKILASSDNALFALLACYVVQKAITYHLCLICVI